MVEAQLINIRILKFIIYKPEFKVHHWWGAGEVHRHQVQEREKLIHKKKHIIPVTL